MKILVTGGAGFIGHNVVLHLEHEGHTVAIMDNFSSADEALYDERLEGIKAHIYKSNIGTTIARTHASIFEPEIIIHLASSPNSKTVDADPEEATKSMVTGLENMLLAAARNASVKRFIYISSSMVYGHFEGDEAAEQHTKSPINLYGSLKLAGEQMTKLYAERYGFEYAIIRPSAVYGPCDTDDRVIAKFFRQAMANEILYCHGADERLDFTYVDDIAKGIVQAALATIYTPAICSNQVIFNMTYGEARTLHDTATHIVKVTGSESDINWWHAQSNMPSRGRLDCSTAKDAFGFEPTINLEKGIELYYDWLRNRSV